MIIPEKIHERELLSSNAFADGMKHQRDEVQPALIEENIRLKEKLKELKLRLLHRAS